ncbi:MAG: hypothetical protein AB7P04_01205 [Bacteriovoracia bacterium]
MLLSLMMGLIMNTGWMAEMANASGREVGNGGDAYSQEFISLGGSLAARWHELGFTEALPVKQEAFQSATEKVRVISTEEKLILRGEEVDAINYPLCKEGETPETHPCGKIRLNRSRWDALKDRRHRKVALVLHEYLGTLGTDETRFDDYYEASGPLLARLKKLLAEKPLVEVNFSCRIERWDVKTKGTVVAATLDTYHAPSAAEIKLGTGKVFPAYFLSIAKVGSDFLASVQIDRLEYRIYKRRDIGSPLEGETLTGGYIPFTVNGKNSIRALNDPELQLTCYRTLDQVNPPPEL